MNSPAIPSERALAQQGQMLHSLLSEAVRSYVATAHGNPAVKDLAGLKQDEYGV